MEDNLQWKMTFDGRRPSMKDDLQWKTTDTDTNTNFCLYMACLGDALTTATVWPFFYTTYKKNGTLYCQAQPQLQPQLRLWLRLVIFFNSSYQPANPTPKQRKYFNTI